MEDPSSSLHAGLVTEALGKPAMVYRLIAGDGGGQHFASLSGVKGQYGHTGNQRQIYE